MAERFPPRADGPAAQRLRQFVDGIAASPSTYGMGPPEVESIDRAVRLFEDAFRIASNRNTRSTTDVSLKDQTRLGAEAICRVYRNLIRHNAGISFEDKMAIYATPDNPSRTKRFAPLSPPGIAILATTNGAHTLRYFDPLNPTRTAKPFGANALLVFRAITDRPVTDRQHAAYVCRVTTTPFPVLFDAKDNGRVATYFAVWEGRRGDTSGWSAPVSMTIAS